MPDDDRPDTFYVGYLPMPPPLKRWVRGVVIFLMLIVAGAAVLLASQQRDPGPAVWEDDPDAFQGVLLTRPYPMLWSTDEPGRARLVIAEGKWGVMDRVARLDDKPVRLRGTLLRREGWEMIELPDEADAIESLPSSLSVTSYAAPKLQTTVTLYGQIIDPKCFMGAMKPGEGKTHKACATLCLRGGIPPMFMQYDDTGPAKYYLLADEDGGPLVDEKLQRVIPYVADDVELSGRLAQVSEWHILYLDTERIERR